jgi:PKD repeat protein
MLPVNTVFPEFVPDQLLTSDDLNELFGYLDEQGRMTRTNLIGIGIVCGLEVRLNEQRTELTITRGVGVTSEGWLITVPTITYSEFNTYDAVKEEYYDRFVDVGTKTQKFNLWELKQDAIDPEASDINAAFLEDKVVLLFVELLREKNKNCDPNSCDDKGVHVSITFRPLLVQRGDAESLIGASGGSLNENVFTSLPAIRMRRFDVPNTGPVTSADIFKAYQEILGPAFLAKAEAALSHAYANFGPFVSGEHPTDPFSGLAADFAFLTNGSVNSNQLQHIQYYYDLFSDLLLAYEELRKRGSVIVSVCCPDSNLFPRHLLLGEAVPLANGTRSAFRHYFIYSPLFDQRNIFAELRSLFQRLVLLRQRFQLPAVNAGVAAARLDPNIRITPSMLWDVPLSQKAIPYYYNVAGPQLPLYEFWNFRKKREGNAHRNLSYHANLYNATDEFVLKPLLYDLEPYNFLRIEGIIGKNYASVLRNIKRQISDNRLPVDVIALNTENPKFLESISLNRATGISATVSGQDLLTTLCHFQDLEAIYDTMKAELLCNLCKELKYYYDIPFAFNPKLLEGTVKVEGLPSQAGLFDYCNKGYIVRERTLGALIERVYRAVGDEGDVTIQVIAHALNLDRRVDDATGNVTSASNVYLGFLASLFRIPIYIIRLANTFTANLDGFDVDEFCRVHRMLADEANSLKFLFNMFTAADRQSLRTEGLTSVSAASSSRAVGTDFAINDNLAIFRAFAISQNSTASLLMLIFMLEDFFDHLDTLIYQCKCSAFKSLRAEWLQRVRYITMLRQFGYFTRLHPGIQHKAGVPMGGTFIIVYHSRRSRVTQGTVKGRYIISGTILDETGAPLPAVSITAQGTTRATVTDAAGKFRLVVAELPATLNITFVGFEQKQFTVESEEPVTIVMGENGDDDNSDTDALSNIAEGTVIADFYLPYRCCSDCPPIQYVVQESVDTPPANQGPIANAGPDQSIVLPVSSATLNGSASTDPDGTIAKFEWIRLSGPGAANIVTPNSSQTSVGNLVEGVYEFELTVTDDKGAIARDTMILVVNAAPPPPNQPPVANAGNDQLITISPNSPVLLDGSASSDPDGVITSFRWRTISGPNTPTIVSPNLVQTIVTNLSPGIYEFELTVTDNDGASSNDTVRITAERAPNQLPVANAGNDITITLPLNTVVLNGSGTDPDGTVTAFSWRFIGGPSAPLIGSPNNAQTQVGNLQAGTYEFELVVKDDRGGTGADTVRVTVNRAPQNQKVCGPLADIITAFEKLPDIDPNNFGSFTNADGFRSFGEVKEYFSVMAGVQGSTPEKQIDFFKGLFLRQSIQQLLSKWLTELFNIISGQRKDIRLLALSLYRLLVQLAMFIVCIQKEDFNSGPIPMDGVFKLIMTHIRRWLPLIQQGVFSPEQIAVVKKIGDDIKIEVARVNSNGESNAKPNYVQFLQEIVSIINTIP